MESNARGAAVARRLTGLRMMMLLMLVRFGYYLKVVSCSLLMMCLGCGYLIVLAMFKHCTVVVQEVTALKSFFAIEITMCSARRE
jgi:hypothetical protein